MRMPKGEVPTAYSSVMVISCFFEITNETRCLSKEVYPPHQEPPQSLTSSDSREPEKELPRFPHQLRVLIDIINQNSGHRPSAMLHC
jgi:hypothetical protein